MAGDRNNQKYEALYTELLGRGEMLHESNKRRIRRGLIILVILPFVLEFIRWITDSDKVVFLIIWILIMFVLSAYLISIEYLDYSIEETLRDVTDTEADFGGLLPRPELRRGDLHERIRARFAALRDEESGEEDADDDDYDEVPGEEFVRGSDEKTVIVPAGKPANAPDRKPVLAPDVTLVLDDVIAQAQDVKEAEAAMEELNETVPAEIITAMKEAFDADIRKRGRMAEGADANAPAQDRPDDAGQGSAYDAGQGSAYDAGEEVPE